MGRELLRQIHRVLVTLLTIALVVGSFRIASSITDIVTRRIPSFDTMWLDSLWIVIGFAVICRVALYEFPSSVTMFFSEAGIEVMPLYAERSAFIPWQEIKSARYSRLLRTVTFRSHRLGRPYKAADSRKNFKEGEFDSTIAIVKRCIGDRWRERWL